MAKTRLARIVFIFVVIFVLAMGALTYFHYQRDLRQARARVSSGSQIAQTPCGPIEYADVGNGPPVLVVHGAGGGFDQGLDFSQDLVESGFRVITVSRFGYLRTPLPKDASAAAQADAHACLLDALNIRTVTMAGASAGAPSSMQFALRHPERCVAMILVVPMAYQPPNGEGPNTESSGLTEFFFNTALKSDFLFWMATKTARKALIKAILATPPEAVEGADSSEQTRVQQILDHISPVSRRRLGLLNDAAVVSSLTRYELERITVPTLVISVADDLFGSFERARYTARHIPGARFIGYPSGGHVWAGRQKELWSEILSFLKSHAAQNIQ